MDHARIVKEILAETLARAVLVVLGHIQQSQEQLEA